MAWEKTMLDVASEAGLRVPHSRLTTVGARNVLLHAIDTQLAALTDLAKG